jgi:two-component system sensor histidine kinase YesM
LGNRVLIIVSVTMIASLLLSGSISFFSLWETQQNHSRTILETALYQMSMEIDRDYYGLLQLSQNMASSGPVGIIVEEYLHAVDMYEKGMAMRKLTRAMSTYSGLNSELVMYFNQDKNAEVFYNFHPVTSFFLMNWRHTLYSNYLLAYHAIHRSQNRMSGKDVVSLERKVGFSDDQELTIYVEACTQIPAIVQTLCVTQNLPYVFVQLNSSGIVCYSTDASVLPAGVKPMLEYSDFGKYKGYYYAKSGTAFGSNSLLFLPASSFHRGLNQWMMRSGFALLLIALFVLAASYLLYHYVFSSLSIFSREIDKTARGNLEVSAEHTGIAELDALLNHFDDMKSQIKTIMAEKSDHERMRRHEEQERLIYQINPHFLLNTLNSVHWLAAIKNEAEISRYISNLSTILSYNLGRTKQQPTLRSELNMLQLYLEIEKSRHDFSSHMEIEEGKYLDMRTPRLILQPIVENSIGHGMDDGGNVLIKSHYDSMQGAVIVTIADDGCGIPEEILTKLTAPDIKHGGVGLRYVRAMLESVYGDESTLTIESRPGSGTIVTLVLPWQKEEDTVDPRHDR